MSHSKKNPSFRIPETGNFMIYQDVLFLKNDLIKKNELVA